MAGEDITIRRADLLGEEDARSLARLRWEWRLHRGEQPLHSPEHFERDFAVWSAEHVHTHRAFLAEGPAGEAVGMAWYEGHDRVPGPEHWTRRSGSVQSVYVRPASRGFGTGAELIEAVIRAAAAEGLDHLLVHPTERSVPLYQRAGFATRDQAMERDLRGLPGFGNHLA